MSLHSGLGAEGGSSTASSTADVYRSSVLQDSSSSEQEHVLFKRFEDRAERAGHAKPQTSNRKAAPQTYRQQEGAFSTTQQAWPCITVAELSLLLLQLTARTPPAHPLRCLKASFDAQLYPTPPPPHEAGWVGVGVGGRVGGCVCVCGGGGCELT
jgi:hypothetical protein